MTRWPRSTRFALGETGAAERRIDEEAVRRDPVGEAAWHAVEQIGGDDLEIVVGGVGESALAVAVAERPDAGDVGAQLVVDFDVSRASTATPAASSPRSSVLGRRPVASRRCEPVTACGLAFDVEPRRDLAVAAR